VTATNGVGTGSASSASSAVTLATTPGAPTSVSATAGNGQATISFTAPASNGGSAITGYTVTSNPGGLTGTGSSSPITVTGLTNGTAYTFTVTATNGVGTGSASSASSAVTPATTPGAPTSVSATAGNRQATISFTTPASNGGSAITGYTVTSSPGGLTGTGSSSPITVTGLTNGTAYTFTVKAINIAGASPASAASNSVTPAATTPGAPLSVTATPGNQQATVAFSVPSDNGGSVITGYTVNAWVNGVVTSITATGTSSPIAISGLSNHTAYTFTVTAANAVGTGAASTASNLIIPGPGGNVLIVHDGTAGLEANVVTNLTQKFASTGGISLATNVGVPASLDAYDQVWDLRFNNTTPLNSLDQATYLTFLQRGGMLFLMGEDTGFATRDNSLAQMVVLAAGGGLITTTPANAQVVHAPFTGPVPLSTMTFLAAAGCTQANRGNSASITDDGTTSAALVWAPGTLGNAPKGGLMVVYDVNFMDPGADANSQALVTNLLNYMTRVSKSALLIDHVDVPSAANYKLGSVLSFTVHYNRAVTVTGTPTLPLTLDSNPVVASYASGSGTHDLVFTYTVQARHRGALALGSALSLVGNAGASGSLMDADGFPVSVLLNQVASTNGIQVDGIVPPPPAISGVAGTVVTGMAEAGSTVNLYLDSTFVGSVIADSNGNWSFTILVNQVGFLTARSTDLAGNTSGTSLGSSVDTTLPVVGDVSLTVDSDSADNAVPVSLSGGAATALVVASHPAHGTVRVQGLALTYTPTAGYVGPDSFTYTASNANGTSAPATVSITVKSRILAAPVLQLSMLADGATTSDVLLRVGGVVTAANGLRSLTVEGISVQPLADGRFSYPVRLKTGANTITVIATDQAGLTTQASRTVTLDPMAPVLNLGQPADGAVFKDGHQIIEGVVTLAPESPDPLASVSYALNGAQPQDVTLSGSSFSFGVDLVSGVNTLEVRATTAAGKIVSVQRTVTLSTDLMGAIVDPASDLIVTASSYLLKGSVDSTSLSTSVTITMGGHTYNPPIVNGQFEQALPLDDNQVWPVTVTLADAQGHSLTMVRNLMKAASATPAIFTLSDALRALKIANGLIPAEAEDLAKYDLAPRLNGVSTGDGQIDLDDAALVLWLVSQNP